MADVLFVGGGSLGHIVPSVAVARALREQSSATVLFVCSTRGEDVQFLEEEGMPCITFDSPRLSIAFVWRFPLAIFRAVSCLRQQKPKVIFSKGGYISLPFCIAGWMLRVPIILHETDAVTGYANRIASIVASTVCIGFPGKEPQQKKEVVTGVPLRQDIVSGSRDEALRITGFSGDRPVLLVTGGSQGAQAINEAVTALLPRLVETFDVIHLTGRGKQLTQRSEHYFPLEFAHHELRHLYALTDIAISRAGGTIAELGANTIAVLLVPLRGVAHDHQQKNAALLERLGVCRVLQQDQLEESLLDELHALQESKNAYAKKLFDIVDQNADRQIAQILSRYLA